MNDKRKKVIFIYEGVKAEENLLRSLVKVFFNSTADISILNCPADGNIYMLWTRLKKDDFETNVIDVLKEMSTIAKERLKDYKASSFSEIYLFFDYDGHDDLQPVETKLLCISGFQKLLFLFLHFPMRKSIMVLNI